MATIESWMVKKVNLRAMQALMLNQMAARNPQDAALRREADRMTELAVFGPKLSDGEESFMSIKGLDKVGKFLPREYDLDDSFEKREIICDFLDNLSPSLRRAAMTA